MFISHFLFQTRFAVVAIFVFRSTHCLSMYSYDTIKCVVSESVLYNDVHQAICKHRSKWLLFNANSAIFSYIMTRTRHITLIRGNQSLLFLLNAACLAEKQQIPISVFGFTRTWLELTIFHTRGEDAYHYTTNVRVGMLPTFA